MKTLWKRLPFILLFLTQTTFAQTPSSGLMTTRDSLQNTENSNISLRNNRHSNVAMYGLYVNQYAYVTPGQACTSATTIFSGNITAGSVVSPVTINANSSAAVGGNYLYNMILTAIYYENIIIPSSPPGCALPGCTWGSDTTKYNWCIYLGAFSPESNSPTYTSSVPPAADAASGSGYNYNLMTSYHYLGPISCNDQTQSCAVANPQTQSFS